MSKNSFGSIRREGDLEREDVVEETSVSRELYSKTSIIINVVTTAVVVLVVGGVAFFAIKLVSGW